VRAAVDQGTPTKREAVKSAGFVLDTLSAAYWSLQQSSSFEDAVVTAIGLGGDTDTTGAVVGALAGAHYGLAAIPGRWQSQVQYRDELAQLALDLLGLSES
jgi:ADP-ribosyl-[dinitrogen reductase] hydrolase